MKKYSWIVALLLALSLAFFACDNGGGGDDDKDKDKDKGDTELVTIFDFQDASKGTVTHAIQELPEGALSFADKNNNPLKPIVRAAEDQHASYEIIKVDGKNALKYVTHATWGPGFDLPNSVFGFLAGDKITVTGKAEGDAIDLAFNKNQGGAQTIVGNRVTETGDFTVEVELKAADITAINGNEQKVLRFEDRAGETTVTIYNIVIVGERPTTISKLAAPVVTLTGSTISWAAVTGAGGYKVFALADGGTEAEEVTSLTDETEYDLALSNLEAGDYKITVVALGVAGSSTDSDPSNAVDFTKAAAVLKTVTFSAGMVSSAVDQGTVVIYDSGSGYTWTAIAGGGWGNGYACFKFDLGEPLANFLKLNFIYTPIAGDTSFKAVKLFAATSVIEGYDGGSTAAGLVTLAAPSGNTVTEGDDQEISLVIDAEKAATFGATTELYFAIDIPMGLGTAPDFSSYTIYNVEFVK